MRDLHPHLMNQSPVQSDYGDGADPARRCEQMQKRAEELTIMVDLAQIVSSSLDLKDVLTSVVRTLLHVTKAGGVTLSRWDRETGRLETWVQERSDGLDLSDQDIQYDLNDYPASQDVLDNREPRLIYTDDPEADSAEVALMRPRGISTLLMVPLAKGETTIGLVEIDDCARMEFSPDDIQLCQAIAQQAALAIENARLHSETEHQLWRQTILRQVADVIYASLDHQEVLDRLAEQFAIAIDATSAYICTYDSASFTSTVIAEYLRPSASSLEKETDLYRSYTYPEYEDFLKTPEIVQYYWDDASVAPAEQKHLQQYGCQSVMIVPLQIRGQILAYIEMWESRNRRTFTLEEQGLCREMAQQAAIAIENANLYTQAREEINQRKLAQDELKRSEQDYRGLFENAHDPVIIFDPEQAEILDVNQRACEFYGYNRGEMIGMSLNRIGHDFQVDENHLRQIVESGRYYNYQTVHQRSDGSERGMEVNLSLVHYRGHRAIQSINRDVTERIRAEELLRYEAFHDRLTGLPNRALFTDRLERAIARLQSRRRESLFAVLFLDLDRFKNVNDSRGHNQGDALLGEVACRLAGCMRGTDTVARLGGDEFVILMEDLPDILYATKLCERIKEQLDQPVDLGGDLVFTSASIGVVLSDLAYQTPEEYLRDADIAMYRAKNGGRGRFEVFDTTMREHILRRLALENELRRAVRDQEFVLHYMPIVSLRDGEITGLEALLRWQHPEKGLLLPAEFIEVTEDTGLILPIGRWVLMEACRQMQEWRERFDPDLRIRMSVNLSGEQLSQPDLIDQVRTALQSSGLPAECLSLEVTESALIKDVGMAIKTLSILKAIGVSLQLDDFGTGYSSLSYLRQFPIDVIKIDRSFILNSSMVTDAPDLVRTIVLMGHELGLEVIAEGIETDEQKQRLNLMGCAQGQGFLFSRAVEPARAERFFTAQVAGAQSR